MLANVKGHLFKEVLTKSARPKTNSNKNNLISLFQLH